MEDFVVRLKDVTKKYKLYRNKKDRFKGLFFKKVQYQTKLAINNVSFDVKKGETVAFLGRNGAGKSTLLKMITGIEYPTEGKIKVTGRVSSLLELSAGFEPELTGRENIFLRGYILGYTRKQISKQISEIINFSELEEYIYQPVKTYSSGMKARLGFSILTHFSPQILVVDEALSVGDSAFKKRCLKKIKKIMQTDEVTLLFVTHSERLAQAFCERGIIIKDGAIVCDTNIEEAIAEYRRME